MPLFKKAPREPEPMDDALTYFTRTQADDFRTLARRTFAQRGLEVTVHADHAVDSTGRQFGFWNIGAQCAEAASREWAGLVDRHIAMVLASLDAPSPFEGLSLDAAHASTYARIYPEEALLQQPDRYPHREIAPGLVEALALDLPESVALYRHEDARALGGWEALRAQGIRNLQALPVERLERLDVGGGGSFTALLGDSFYTASRALLLPELAAQVGDPAPTEWGWLMSVPNRHQLVWHVIRDASVIPVLNGMTRFTLLGHESAGSVSPHVYWWNGSGYEQLTSIDDEGTPSIHAGQAFADVLNAVVGDG